MFVIVYFIFELNSDSELISSMIINDKKRNSAIQFRRDVRSNQFKRNTWELVNSDGTHDRYTRHYRRSWVICRLSNFIYKRAARDMERKTDEKTELSEIDI